jgi:fucose permease
MTKNYNRTIYACFTSFVVQAIINNFVPLLFLTFQRTYNITLDQLALLITLNFGMQLLIDLLSSKFIDKIGYRTSIIGAHIFAAAGLLALTFLPQIAPTPYMGIAISVVLYAMGGGLIEVLASPIVEACPTEHKEGTMSLLHSFYCWGQVGVVLISTLFFALIGIDKWKWISVFWAIIPIFNAFAFLKAPIAPLVDEGKGLSVSELFRLKTFWVMVILMLCAGACELSVSQWASAFMESALGVSKTIGDLAGPAFFAICMGTARVYYAKRSTAIRLTDFMLGSGILCAISYLMISLSPWPTLSFLGCGLCGLSVGILWPGTFSIAAKKIPTGGTALFALLALAGDLGCSSGPTFVGFISSAFQDNLKVGIFFAILFPLLLLLGLHINKKHQATDSIVK